MRDRGEKEKQASESESPEREEGMMMIRGRLMMTEVKLSELRPCLSHINEADELLVIPVHSSHTFDLVA